MKADDARREPLPDLLTLEEAADALRLMRRTLYQPEWKQRLGVVRVGGRLLVPADAVRRLLTGGQS